MATVLRNRYAGEDVVIMVEYSDGDCIVDRGEAGDGGMAIVNIRDMRLWRQVKSVGVPLHGGDQ